MKILVTGGAGFIGSHLVDQLVELSHDVVIVDNLMTGKVENINTKAKFYEVDILNSEFPNVVSNENPEVIFHLASVRDGVDLGIKDTDMDKANIMGTMKVLDICVDVGVRKIIYASSIDVYGKISGNSIDENEILVPKTNYALSKYIPEKYIKAYAGKYGLDFSILRISNVYGKRMTVNGEGNLVFNLLKEDISNEQTVANDYVYIKDVVDALVQVLGKGQREIYNVGFGTSYKLDQKLIYKNVSAYYSGKKYFEIKKAKLDLGYEPRFDLNSGLRDMNYGVGLKII